MSDQLTSFLDSSLFTSSIQNDSVVLVNFDLLASSQVLRLNILKLHTSLLRNDGSSCKKSNILHGGLSVISETRSLHSAHLDASSKLVDDQSGKGLAFDILGDDKKGRLALDDGFEKGNKLLKAANLLFDQKDKGILQNASLCLGIRDEVGTDETTLKFHTLDDFQFVLKRLSVLDSDDTLLSNTFHGIRNEMSDFLVGVSRDGSNLGDFFLRSNGSANFLQGCDDLLDG
mmetsp:Transcript_45077/g.130165  ORF Transcript_45077/g.130165 Transcript_45077/m.130165 type:complete len:230 (+) Transcript_45077:637-1326(+)